MGVCCSWILQTARLRLTPVRYGDLPDLTQLKADPLAYARMLGGVCAPPQTGIELAQDIQDWGRYGFGMWTVRNQRDDFLGITALMHRPDARGVALRFAFFPQARGAGLAREAASAALIYGHDKARLTEIIAVTRADNYGSRQVLCAIGMKLFQEFQRQGDLFLVYRSVSPAVPL